MERGKGMKLIVLKTAINDVNEIHEALVEYGSGPSDKFKLSFKKFCTQVVVTPFMYPEYAPVPDYRRAVLEYGYLLFYKVDIKYGIVKIYRVLHGKRKVTLT